MKILSNKELWDEFYKEGKYIMEFPGEPAIKFFGRISKDMDVKGMKGLDFGCGAGRHTFLMKQLGLKAYGIDISEVSIELAKEKARKEGWNVGLCVYDGKKIPFGDNYFDFVISHGVLDHIFFDEAKGLMKEIHRVLKPNGLCELEIHSTHDSRYGKGKEIERNVFIINDDCEKGLPQHFFNAHEVSELVKDFKIKETILHEEIFIRKGKTSFYVLYLEKW
jgi:ubiquinone/menaquinone biosynthesis C-methylase UbiE